jgi:hypothetical protein
MWLVRRLAPDFKTIADFRKDNGAAIRAVCSQFVVLCRQLGLFKPPRQSVLSASRPLRLRNTYPSAEGRLFWIV